MRLNQNVKAISKLSLITLLSISAIIGAFITYVWVEGYYYSLDLRLPEKTTLSITNSTFPLQSTFSFNVTVLNPSYSPSTASITQIATLTKDGVANVTSTEPVLPSPLSRGESKTFTCQWNWANYTGQEIIILAFTSDGTGVTTQAKTPFVGLSITSMDIDRFEMTKIAPLNVTIQNSGASATKVNVTEILFDQSPLEGINVTFPYTLDQGAKVTLTGTWNWTDFTGENLDLIIKTEEGYVAFIAQEIPPSTPVATITNVLFDSTDTNHFNVTVHNNKLSTNFISVRGILINLENGTTIEIEQINPSLEPAYIIHPGNSTIFQCTWNWAGYQNKNVTVSIRTLQEYTAQRTVVTPVSVGSIVELATSPFLAITIISNTWIMCLSKKKN